MSMCLTIDLKQSGGQLDPRFPGSYFNAYGLADAAWDLDRLITEGGIRRFTDFIYDGNILSDEEYAEMGQTRPEQIWFDASDGIRTVAHLISLLRLRNDEEPIEGCTVGDLIAELEVVQGILQRAEQSGEPFSFEVA
jgi:hypothetical protein